MESTLQNEMTHLFRMSFLDRKITNGKSKSVSGADEMEGQHAIQLV